MSMKKLGYLFLVLLLVVPALAQATVNIDPGDLGPNFNNPFACNAIQQIINIFFGGCGPAGAHTASEFISE